MIILNSSLQDIEDIFKIYHFAQVFQKSKKKVVIWPDFDRKLVEKDISENRQFKIIIDGKTACVWAITYSDPEIWQEKSADKALYIHRIATSPQFRGYGFVKVIAGWAIDFAKEKNLDFVRLDTLGRNENLINVYTKAGFTFLGMFDLKETQNLPKHYQEGHQAALFEMSL